MLMRTVGSPLRSARPSRRKQALGALLGSVLIVTAAAPAGASAIKVPAKYHGTLRVAMDATYPPDEFIQGGHIVGFDADLAQALGKAMGVKMKLVDATFDTIIPGIEGGKYDLGNSSFTDTKAREQQVDFVDYFSAGEGFYELADSEAMAQAKRCHVNVESFDNQNEANLAVTSHRADVGFADSQVAAWIVHQSHGQFKLTGKPFETAPYGFIVAKGSGLAQPLLDAVKAIMANGQYKKILDKWGVEQGAIAHPVINGASS